MSIRLAYAPALTAEGILNLIEGANEDDTVPQGPRNTPAATVLLQQQVYAMGQFLSLPSINMSLGFGWTAANNWHGDYDKVGDLSAYTTSMLVSDPLTGSGTIQTGSDTSTSVSVPDHSILIKTIGPATPAISPPVVLPPVVMSPAARLSTPLTTLPDTATSVATAHVTVDYWNHAGQESTKTLNVTASAPASAVAAVAAVSSNNAAITSVTTTAATTMSFLSSATLATAVAGSKVTVMPKAGAAPVTLTPNFTAGAVLDFHPTMAQTSWDGKLGDRGGWQSFDVAISGASCLNTAPLMSTRSENDEANTTDAQRAFEGKSGFGCAGRQEGAGRLGATL